MDEEFAAFVRGRYLPLVRRAYLLTGDAAAAEDLTQDALAALLLAWRRGDLRDPERYVARTLTRRAVSRWRLKSRTDLLTDLVPEPPPGVTDEDRTDERDLLRRALRELPPRQRAVLVLRYFEDLADDEVADLLEVSPSTVRSQASRAVERLRRDGALRDGLEEVR